MCHTVYLRPKRSSVRDCQLPSATSPAEKISNIVLTTDQLMQLLEPPAGETKADQIIERIETLSHVVLRLVEAIDRLKQVTSQQ